jgi:hypothetical protein
MRRIIFIFLLFISAVSAINAQDNILKRNGEEVQAKVTDVGKTEIKYKKFSNLSGPEYVMLVSDIFMITYENGDKDVFEESTETNELSASSVESENASIPDEVTEFTESTPDDTDYALLHVYRSSFMGAAISYDLHLDDQVICRVKYKSKETIRIDKEGLYTLWARTETRTELPIDIQLGNEYYIRCSVKMGVAVGRPQLEIVDNKTGIKEFNSVKDKKK